MKRHLLLCLAFAGAACDRSPVGEAPEAVEPTQASQTGEPAPPPKVGKAETPTPPTQKPAPDVKTEPYVARGQEPGWIVTIANGRIDYVGNYGEKRVDVARPDPRTTSNGHRYETEKLIVEVTHGRCNDAMSGQGYADQVTVIADGETYRGCGGERRPDWDN